MKKSYETPTIWKENRFTIKSEYMLNNISLSGKMVISNDEVIDITDGTGDYATDHILEGFSGPSAKERKEEEWGRLW